MAARACEPLPALGTYGLSVGDGVPLQFDYYGHLTEQGAVYLARKVGPLFLPSLSSKSTRSAPG